MATTTKPVQAPIVKKDVTPLVPEAQGIPIDVTGYNTDLKFLATRYRQGGRVVYSLDLSPVEIASLIPAPDPSRPTPGNRAVRPKHAQGFAAYVREHDAWVSPAMILRAPAIFNFETIAEVAGREFGTVSFPRLSLMDIHILDGQHRILGFHLAIQGITEDLDKARSALASANRVDPKSKAVQHAKDRIKELEDQRKRLAEEAVTVQIIIEEDATAYKQAFFDIADNQLGITASVKARFDNRKVTNRALEEVLEHPLLTGRVDPEGDRIGRGSPFWMGAKHVAEVVRVVQVGLDGRISRRQESELKERDLAANTKAFLTVLHDSFPQLQAMALGQILPDDLRKTSLLGSVAMIRALAGVYHDLIAEHAFTKEMVGEFFVTMAPHMIGPVHQDSIWMKRLENVFSEGGMAPHARRQDLKVVNQALDRWAVEKPAWLLEAPKSRPVQPTAEDEIDYGKGHDGFGGVPAPVDKTQVNVKRPTKKS